MRRGFTIALLALACSGGAWADDEGLASWYGARFHGRRTASGAKFDMHALTAAHPTLPFGTRVLVRNLLTGKEVEVRITDRGPHIKRRIIDLSQAAARAIGMARGVAKVRVTVLGEDEPTS
jgi:rare lipoprotein A